MEHVYIQFFKNKSISNHPRVKILSDTLSNLDNHGEYSNYQLYSSQIDMAHVIYTIFQSRFEMVPG